MSCIPDFGMHRTEFQGVALECRYVAPGLTMQDLTRLFGEAEKGGDRLAGDPTKWPQVRGINAVLEAVLAAIYDSPFDPRKRANCAGAANALSSDNGESA